MSKTKGFLLAVAVAAMVFTSCTRPPPPITPGSQFNSDIEVYASFTDSRDGKTYKSVVIGTQTWMAENLNYDASGSKCYNNDPAYCETYGRLYDWETAKNVCPSGWHLPSKDEYETQERAVGGEETAGKKLKAKSGWNEPGNGTDNYGFSALPGGYGFSNGSSRLAGDVGYWWTSTEYNSEYVYHRGMGYKMENIYWYYNGKPFLHSVRCVQD